MHTILFANDETMTSDIKKRPISSEPRMLPVCQDPHPPPAVNPKPKDRECQRSEIVIFGLKKFNILCGEKSLANFVCGGKHDNYNIWIVPSASFVSSKYMFHLWQIESLLCLPHVHWRLVQLGNIQFARHFRKNLGKARQREERVWVQKLWPSPWVAF